MEHSAVTEHISRRYLGVETWDSEDVLRALFESQLAGLAAVQPALAAIQGAALVAAERLAKSGRLVYVGAGTSGRIAVQDGAELAPTFGWPRDRLVLRMAGGAAALTTGIEGAEDDCTAAAAATAALKLGSEDVVVGVAASGTTAYTVGFVSAAQASGSLTVGIANVAETALLAAVEHPILLPTGAEVIAGSTRLKAGTAQKVTLNLFSTLLMVRLGRSHDGLMVDMQPTNAKLRRRAIRMVVEITDCDTATAEAALRRGDQHVKTAVLLVRGLSLDDARASLARHGGHLRHALAETRP